jgi:hypothetical protein
VTEFATQLSDLQTQVSSLRVLVGVQLLLLAGLLGALLTLLSRTRRAGEAQAQHGRETSEAVTLLRQQGPDVADAGAEARVGRKFRKDAEERRRERICGTGTPRPPMS